jgi:hypothetical protein
LYLPPSHWCQSPGRTCLVYLFSVLEKKKRHFGLFKIAIQCFIVTFSCIYVL